MRWILFSLTLFTLNPLFARDLIKVQVAAKYPIKRLIISGQGLKVNNIAIPDQVMRLEVAGSRINSSSVACDKGCTVSSKHNKIRLEWSFKQKRYSRVYTGLVNISLVNNRIQVVLAIPLEKYVANAVLSETGSLLHMLKGKQKENLVSAMEVAIRSYIVSQKHRHGAQPYSFCDLTHCVHFQGGEKRKVHTPGVVLVSRKDKAITGFFHSSCGGRLSRPSGMWQGAVDSYDPPDWDGEKEREAYCVDSPDANWQYQFYTKDQDKIFGAGNTIKDVTYKNKRVSSILLTSGKSLTISRFMSMAGRNFGWSAVKSNYFTIKKNKKGILIKGHGAGHGVGLCQWGALQMAKEGKTYRQIIKHYFRGAKLEKLPK